MNDLHVEYQNLQNRALASYENESILYNGNAQTPQSNDATKSTIQAQQQSQNQNYHNDQHFLKSDSTQYSWVGNQWIPPPGVPTYSPSDLLHYFQNRNVLFIGDSTARRAWATAYAMMNATDLTYVRTKEVDHADVIDYHKRAKKHFRQCYSDDRGARKETQRQMEILFSQYECRDLPKSKVKGDENLDELDANGLNDNVVVVGDDDETNKKETSRRVLNERKPKLGPRDIQITDEEKEKKGRFDFTFFTCYGQVAWFVRPDEDNIMFNQNIKPYYDLIIVGLGIWKIVNDAECDRNSPNDPHPNRLERLLKNLKAQSSPELQIVYRSCGFDAREELRTHPRVEEFTNVIHNFFDDSGMDDDTAVNLTFVDWAVPLKKRSYGEDRINGDLPPHYGLEARTLFLQQMMHELKKAELQQQN